MVTFADFFLAFAIHGALGLWILRGFQTWCLYLCASVRCPTFLLYVDEVPPLIVRLALSAQHIFLMSIGWLYVAMIVSAVGGTQAQAESMIRISMLAGDLATILQSSRTIIGSGYLCPLSGSLTYLQPSIAAASGGGFPLLFGMVSAAGLFSGFLSRLTSRLRILFPPEVTGLMISMSGLQLVALGCPRFVGYAGAESIPQFRSVVVGIVTLLAMVAATVWHRGKLHVLPMLIGLSAGFSFALALGVLPWQQLVHEFQDPWISMPHRAATGLVFRLSLLLPFLIASLTASLKSVGDLTLCQKINDADWKRTDMKSISGGLFANAAGTFVSGVLGECRPEYGFQQRWSLTRNRHHQPLNRSSYRPPSHGPGFFPADFGEIRSHADACDGRDADLFRVLHYSRWGAVANLAHARRTTHFCRRNIARFWSQRRDFPASLPFCPRSTSSYIYFPPRPRLPRY